MPSGRASRSSRDPGTSGLLVTVPSARLIHGLSFAAAALHPATGCGVGARAAGSQGSSGGEYRVRQDRKRSGSIGHHRRSHENPGGCIGSRRGFVVVGSRERHLRRIGRELGSIYSRGSRSHDGARVGACGYAGGNVSTTPTTPTHIPITMPTQVFARLHRVSPTSGSRSSNGNQYRSIIRAQ